MEMNKISKLMGKLNESHKVVPTDEQLQESNSIKVGNTSYYSYKGKYYKKDSSGKKTEISKSEYEKIASKEDDKSTKSGKKTDAKNDKKGTESIEKDLGVKFSKTRKGNIESDLVKFSKVKGKLDKLFKGAEFRRVQGPMGGVYGGVHIVDGKYITVLSNDYAEDPDRFTDDSEVTIHVEQ